MTVSRCHYHDRKVDSQDETFVACGGETTPKVSSFNVTLCSQVVVRVEVQWNDILIDYLD